MEEQWYRGVYLQPDGDERFFFEISYVYLCNAPALDSQHAVIGQTQSDNVIFGNNVMEYVNSMVNK